MFPDANLAKGRAEYIQGVLRNSGLGAEHDYLQGPVLVRVTGNLSPSKAQDHERALGLLGLEGIGRELGEEVLKPGPAKHDQHRCGMPALHHGLMYQPPRQVNEATCAKHPFVSARRHVRVSQTQQAKSWSRFGEILPPAPPNQRRSSSQGPLHAPTRLAAASHALNPGWQPAVHQPAAAALHAPSTPTARIEGRVSAEAPSLLHLAQ